MDDIRPALNVHWPAQPSSMSRYTVGSSADSLTLATKVVPEMLSELVKSVMSRSGACFVSDGLIQLSGSCAKAVAVGLADGLTSSDRCPRLSIMKSPSRF